MYVVDTNILMSLKDLDKLIDTLKDVKIPVEVLYELDNLKTNPGEKGFKARRAIKSINKHFGDLTFLQNREDDNLYHSMAMTPVDDIIIGYCLQKKYLKKAVLVTNDISMKIKAAALGIKTMSYREDFSLPECLTEIHMSDAAYEQFKENPQNDFGVLPGQFLVIYDIQGENIIEIKKYCGEIYWEDVPITGKIKNYLFKVDSRDAYQACAIQSLYEDDFTVIVGPAGTGKTLLSLAYCLKKIKEEGVKVHIFVNPVKTRDTEQLGYYPGSRNEKLLQNFIGGILSNKIGDMTEVASLMCDGLLNIYPFSDIRGIEIAEGDIMYITEAQNLSVDLMKLAVQRCAEGSKIIIEGDPFTQVDKEAFQGESNGLKRLIEVFVGDEEVNFSYVHLKNIYRSKIAEKAERM